MKLLIDRICDAWGAVVFTVMLVCAAAPLICTKVDAQLGAGLALVATVHPSVTVPLNPPDGVMVVVNVAPLPAVTVAADGLGVDNAKFPPVPVTVSVTLAGCASDPEVPITVTV